MIDWFFTLNSFPVVTAISKLIIHSFWQLSIVVIIVSLILKLIPQKKSNLRYFILLSSYVFAILISGISFSTFIGSAAETGSNELWSVSLSKPDNISSLITNQSFLELISRYLVKYSSLLFLIWFAGVLFFNIKYFYGLLCLNRIKKTGFSLESHHWIDFTNTIARKLKVNRSIRFIKSGNIISPMVYGLFKPVIVVPLSFFSDLPIEHLEAIIAHEMAHLKRKDHIVKLIQAYFDIIFFYHPAIWWLSNEINQEREICCDVMAVEISGNNLHYVEALTSLEFNKPNIYQSMVPTLGSQNQNQLLKRIKRIMNKNVKNPRVPSGLFLILVFVISFSLFGFKNRNEHRENPLIVKKQEAKKPAGLLFNMQDTIKKKRKEIIEFVRVENGEQEKASLSIEDGKVKELIVNGEKIPEKEWDEFSDLIQEMQKTDKTEQNKMLYEKQMKSSKQDQISLNNEINALVDETIELIDIGVKRGGEILEEIQRDLESGKYEKQMEEFVNFLEESGRKLEYHLQEMQDEHSNSLQAEREAYYRELEDLNKQRAELEAERMNDQVKRHLEQNRMQAEKNLQLMIKMQNELEEMHAKLNTSELNEEIEKKLKYSVESLEENLQMLQKQNKMLHAENNEIMKDHEMQMKKQLLMQKREQERQIMDQKRKVQEMEKKRIEEIRKAELIRKKEIEKLKVEKIMKEKEARKKEARIANAISKELYEDGLLDSSDPMEFDLGEKKLILNGKKQKRKVFKKYQKLLRELMDTDAESPKFHFIME